jgi:hypothetical protein
VEEEGGEINIEEKEGVFLEVDVLQILVEEWCHREEELNNHGDGLQYVGS